MRAQALQGSVIHPRHDGDAACRLAIAVSEASLPCVGLASEELVGHLDPRELQGRLVSRIAILEALSGVASVAYAVELYADLSLRVDTLGKRRLPATYLLGGKCGKLSVDSGLTYSIDDIVD